MVSVGYGVIDMGEIGVSECEELLLCSFCGAEVIIKGT